MSDRDSFIDEVSEEVRRDRMYALWRRFGPYVIGGVVVIVALAGAKAWMDANAREEARRAGGVLIAAAETAPTEAAAALADLAERGGTEGAATLARLRAAGVHAAAGEADKAFAACRMVADDVNADPLIREFAAFRAATAGAGDAPPAALIEALAPIAEGNGAFRLLAMEARGAAELAAGDREAAIGTFRAIADDDAAPQGLRQRVQAVLAALGVAQDATG
ncbi:MAG: tetratricopeptide repeat protein [Pikeienuella sp.]